MTFKGKTLTLFTAKGKRVYGMNANCTWQYPSLKKVKKIWGKPAKEKKIDKNQTEVVYKCAGTRIELLFDKKGFVEYDKNHRVKRRSLWISKEIKVTGGATKVCGVQIGMTKAQVIATLKRNHGKAGVQAIDDSIQLAIGGFVPAVFTIKNNRVSDMTFWSS